MNEHATKVLDAYLDSDNQFVPHAVLIEGRWGSGKTFFLQKVYEPARMKRMREEGRSHVPFLFVSLFGATSARDVEMRIYKTACPGEAVAGSIAGTIALGIGEFFRVKDTTKITVEKLGEKAIKRLNEFVFVFDDLERVERQAFGEVMGLVNSLVAEHGRKVLLVTDEEKLKERVDSAVWKDQNEKIVGRRAHIEADLESVIQASISKMPKGIAKKFVSARASDLLTIAKVSRVENLRNLSWAMHNATAFVEALASDSEIPEAHVDRTMGVVLATTLWMRSGLLDAQTLARLPGLAMTLAVRSINNRQENTPLEPQLARAQEFAVTFNSLSVGAPPLEYGFIIGFEESGVLDAREVNAWIKTQFGFGKEHVEPSWRRLWHSGSRPLADTEIAVSDLHDELAHFVFREHGAILHAAGLAIRQAKFNDARITGGCNIVGYFKQYIDRLAADGLLEPAKYEHLPTVSDSYEGLGFSSSDTEEFREIADYLRAKSMVVAAAKRLTRVESIIAEVEEGDFEALFKFVRLECHELSQRPVLMEIPPARIASFMLRDVPELDAGARLLAYRYNRAVSGDPLCQEIKWAREVHAAVVEGLQDWKKPHDQLALDHMNGLIRYYEKDKQNPDDMIIPPS
ncbi:P-loop NTPase fold protein [Rhizobium johnstonii]|uniref:P-loop NTPase fold protein n=1 Tax=Rhizobium johnstonii TaxID=3019933 RepID=UPI003F9E71AE